MINNLSILSKLNFENEVDGESTSRINDNNLNSELVWVTSGSTKIETSDDVKIFNILDNLGKIYTEQDLISNLSNTNFHIEMNIYINTLKYENVLLGISNSASESFKILIRNKKINGFSLFCNGATLSANYKFENNKKYNICVVKESNTYTFYVNGITIGHTNSIEFTKYINTPDSSKIILGSGGHTTANLLNSFIGGISNFNMSYGGNLKYNNTSFTKYGANLISKLSFQNRVNNLNALTYICDLESVANPKITWTYDKSVNNNGILNGNTFKSSNIPNINTIFVDTSNFVNVDSIDLINFNDKYKVIYSSKKITDEKYDNIITSNVTSALNFNNNNYIDNIETTVWEYNNIEIKNDTIVGYNYIEFNLIHNSFLNTSSSVISGGETPFSIDFNFRLNYDQPQELTKYVLFSTNDDIEQFQGLYVSSETMEVIYERQLHSHEVISNLSNLKTSKIKFNQTHKINLSFDGTAIRIFVDGVLDSTINTSLGLINTSDPLRLMTNVNGSLYNLNIFNNVINLTRDKKSFDEYLLVDAPFDGVLNNNKIVDLISFVDETLDTNIWSVSGNAKNSFVDGISNLYFETVDDYITSNNTNLLLGSKFVINFEFIRLNDSNNDVIISNINSLNDETMLSIIGVNSLNDGSNLYISGQTNLNNEKIVYKSKTIIEVNKKYNIHITSDSNYLYIYINGILDDYYLIDTIFDFSHGGGVNIGHNNNNGLIGYVKNMKIYNNTFFKPELVRAKTKLRCVENNIIDMYGNSSFVGINTSNENLKSVNNAIRINNGMIQSSSNYLFNFNNTQGGVTCDFNIITKNDEWNALITSDEVSKIDRSFVSIQNNSNSIRLRAPNDQPNDIPFKYNTNTFYNLNIYKTYNNVFLYINDCLIGSNNTKILNFNANNNVSIFGDEAKRGNGYIANFESYSDRRENMSEYNLDKVNKYYLDGELHVDFNANGGGEYYVVKYDDSPSLKNFISEFDVYVQNSKSYGGLVFRTTNEYSNITKHGTIGYYLYVTGSNLRFGFGGDDDAGVWNLLKSYSLTENMLHKIKIIANESNFKVYVNGNIVFDINDSTHSSSSKFGSIFYDYTNNLNHNISNIVISDLNENVLYRSNFNNYEKDFDNNIPLIHLPLENSYANLGYSRSTININSSPPFQLIQGVRCVGFDNSRFFTFSKNDFNFGDSMDFYIEFDMFFNQDSGTTWQRIFAINSNISQYLYINNHSSSLKMCYGSTSLLDKSYFYRKWTNVKLIRSNKQFIIIFDDEHKFNLPNSNITSDNPTLGTDNNVKGDYFRGYISNFKVFINKDHEPEVYKNNYNLVFDLDFRQTNKSYLFKENNNKVVIHHPDTLTNNVYDDNGYYLNSNINNYITIDKYDSLNFGLDDFVLKLKFIITDKSRDNNMIIMSGGVSTGRTYIGVCGSNINESLFKNKLVLSNTGGTGIFASNMNIEVGVLYDVMFVRRENNYLDLYINGVLDKTVTNWTVTPNNTIRNTNFNFNLNNSTKIGGSESDENQYFQGKIYEIKVLRNTTDIRLLNKSDNNIETFTLSNGVSNNSIEIKNVKEHKIKILNDLNKIDLYVDDYQVEVEKTEDINSIELFNDYHGDIEDVRVYNDIIDDDIFLGSEDVDIELNNIEHECIDELCINEIYQGDYNIIGFIEGNESAQYSIYDKYTNDYILKGFGDYFYNNILEKDIDYYEIYEHETGQRYPLYKHEMIKGYLEGNINVESCNVPEDDLEILCFRSDNNRYIGTYENRNNSYRINNLDVNSKYNIILSNKSKTIESKILSNRTPIKY